MDKDMLNGALDNIDQSSFHPPSFLRGEANIMGDKNKSPNLRSPSDEK